MDLTEEEAAEIADECVAAIEWQVSFIVNPDSDRIDGAGMIAALRPKRAATLRTIVAMKGGDGYRMMKEGAPPGSADFRIVLMPSTCRSIAGSLAICGFRRHADRITEALDRADVVARGH